MDSSHNKFILICFILFFTALNWVPSENVSTTNYKAPASVSSADCMTLIRDFLKGDLLNNMLLDFKAYEELPTQYKKLYEKAISNADLSDEQISAVFENISTLPADLKKVDLFEDYLLTVQTYFSFNRIKGFNDTYQIFTEEGFNSKAMKEFRRRLKKFKKYEDKQFKKHKEKLLKDGAEESEALSKQARKLALDDRKSYRKLYNGCHTKGMTEEHQYGGKAFTYFTVGLSMGSSAIFYTASNYEDEEFGTKEFFGKLTYEMVGDMLWALAASYIFKDPQGSFVSKSAKMYGADNLLIAADGIAWDYFFGNDEEEAKKKLQEIINSPEYKEDVEKLIKTLEQKRFVESMKDNFWNGIDRLRGTESSDIKIDWDKFSDEDLKRPEVREELVRGVLKQEYEDEKGDYIQTGSYAADRYLYYSLLGLPFMFADTMISMKIYQTLCMGRANPGMALGKAMLMFAGYSAFYDAINYPLRKEAIGQ